MKNIKSQAFYKGFMIIQWDDNSISIIAAKGHVKKKLRKAAKALGVHYKKDMYVDGNRILGDNTQSLGAKVIKALTSTEHVHNEERPWWTGSRGDRITRNGVRAPRPETKCGNAWKVYDECYAEGITDNAEVIRRGVAKGLVAGNISTEGTGWRRFHGFLPPKLEAVA